MSSLSHVHANGQTAYLCAQSGCQVCLDALLRSHQGLIHVVMRRQHCGGLAYADLIQEGRIALWRAILRYDPHRGIAFSTYAWRAIERRIWSTVATASRPQGCQIPTESPDPAVQVEAMVQQTAVRAALQRTLRYLPQRLQEVINAAYGLDGQTARSLAALARDYGVTRECVRQWRNDALVLLRLPAFSATLRCVCDAHDRAAYRQAEALNRDWLRQRRGGQR